MEATWPLPSSAEQGFSFFQRCFGAPWRRVPAVQEGVQHDPRQAPLGGDLQKREDLLLLAVHAAGREQAHHVQGAAGRLDPVETLVQRPIAGKLTLLNRPVDPGQILIDHPAGTQVHVADFRVAHLPVRQAHVGAGAGNQGVRRLLPVAIPVGGIWRRQWHCLPRLRCNRNHPER